MIGNFFDLSGITDPDGDNLRVRAIVGTTGFDAAVPNTGGYLDAVPVDRDNSDGITTPPFGEAGTGARIRMFSNGDFDFVPGDFVNRYGDFVVGVDVKYTDDKAVDGSPSAAVDGTKRLNVLVTGGVPANIPPVDPDAGNPVEIPFQA